MGITNFCKLLDPYAPPSPEPRPFDSLIVDCQNLIYVAIDLSLETEEAAFFDEICDHVWKEIQKLIDTFVCFKSAPKELAVVLSFDGDGPPMKHPKQRERRIAGDRHRKSFYKYVLFGHNTLTLSVVLYLTERLKESRIPLTAVISGCNVPGEGEHKIFHVAEKKGYRNPVVASVDQDVFVLCLLRLDRYDSLQVYRYRKFYDVNRLARALPSKRRLVDASFLFGNDFVKPLVSLTPANVDAIRKALECEGGDDDAPASLSRLLKRIPLRFQTQARVERKAMVSFWTIYLWVLDYYTRRCFPQMFLQNDLYDSFDRNQLLTGLSDADYSRDAFKEAEERYSQSESEPVRDAADRVYGDADLRERLRVYWQEPKNGCCTVLRIRSSPP